MAKTKPKRSAKPKSRIKNSGARPKQPRAMGKGPGQSHESYMTGSGSPS
jgi:hypothetical protein